MITNPERFQPAMEEVAKKLGIEGVDWKRFTREFYKLVKYDRPVGFTEMAKALMRFEVMGRLPDEFGYEEFDAACEAAEFGFSPMISQSLEWEKACQEIWDECNAEDSQGEGDLGLDAGQLEGTSLPADRERDDSAGHPGHQCVLRFD